MENFNEFSNFTSVATLLTPDNKIKRRTNIVLYLINFVTVLLFNNSLYISI